MKTTVNFKDKEGEQEEDIELLSHLNKKKLSIIEEKFPKDGNFQNPISHFLSS